MEYNDEPTYTNAELEEINREMEAYCSERDAPDTWMLHKSIAAMIFRRMLDLGAAQERFNRLGMGEKDVTTYRNIIGHLGDMLEPHRIYFNPDCTIMHNNSVWLPENSCLV